jgi:hypothetical protein
MLTIHSDESYLKEVLKDAHKAFNTDEVLIGVVSVCQNRIIAGTRKMGGAKHKTVAGKLSCYCKPDRTNFSACKTYEVISVVNI